LSPSAHAASHAENPDAGWWEAMLGPGKPIDTDRWFVVCVNSLGSCKGSSGPASLDPASGRPWRLDFPELSIDDGARAAQVVVRSLVVRRLACAIGCSLGGMASLAYLLRFPAGARSHTKVSGRARALPLSIAIRLVQREATRRDPNWNGGDYDDERSAET